MFSLVSHSCCHPKLIYLWTGSEVILKKQVIQCGLMPVQHFKFIVVIIIINLKTS